MNMKTSPLPVSGARGIPLHVVTDGDQTKAAIVLVHGYPDNHRVWAPVAERLAKDYYVISYDVRGAGQSGIPNKTADYRLELLAEDLAAVVDALIPGQRFHLVGHDWGSIQAWESVTTDRLRSRIASYTTISEPSLDHAAHWLRRRTTNRSITAKAEVLRQLQNSRYVGLLHVPLLAPGVWSAGLGKRWPRFLAEREKVYGAEENPTQVSDGKHGVQLYRANIWQRLNSRQQRIASCPVQLIVPGGDNYVSTRLFDDLHQWVPELYCRDIQAKHWVMLSHPAVIARWIGEFVSGAEAGSMPQALQRARIHVERSRLPLSGKLAVITGAGSGIGRTTALKFAREGAELVCVDINRESAEQTAVLCRMLGASAWARVTDVGSAVVMEALAAWVGGELGGADIVMNNAGIGMAGGMLDTSVANWERLLHVNLWGVIHGSHLFAQQMIDMRRAGHIINVASAAAFAPSCNTMAYSTSKAAVHMLSECLRAELVGKAICVSAIYPGFADTAIATTTVYAGHSDEEQQRRLARADAMHKRRALSPETVAEAIFKAIQQNRAMTLVGSEAKAVRLISRFAPGISRRVAQIDLLH